MDHDLFDSCTVAMTQEQRRYEEATWTAVSAYMDTHGLVRHQRESFDWFMRNMIPSICTENSDIWSTHSSGSIRHCIRFSNVRIIRPSVREQDGFERSITPMQARLRGLTYASNVLVDATHDVIRCDVNPPKITKRTEYTNVLLARVPTMVNSSFCHMRIGGGRNTENPFEEGGMFIVNGIEKSLCSQMKLRTNMAVVFEGKKVSGTSHRSYVCEVRSCHETKVYAPTVPLITCHVKLHITVTQANVTRRTLSSPLTLPHRRRCEAQAPSISTLRPHRQQLSSL